MIGQTDRNPDCVSLLPSLTELQVSYEALGVDLEVVINSEDVFAEEEVLLRRPAGAASRRLRAVEWNGESHWPLPVKIPGHPLLGELGLFLGWINQRRVYITLDRLRLSLLDSSEGSGHNGSYATRSIGASDDKPGHHRRPVLVKECHDWLHPGSPNPADGLLAHVGRHQAQPSRGDRVICILYGRNCGDISRRNGPFLTFRHFSKSV